MPKKTKKMEIQIEKNKELRIQNEFEKLQEWFFDTYGNFDEGVDFCISYNEDYQDMIIEPIFNTEFEHHFLICYELFRELIEKWHFTLETKKFNTTHGCRWILLVDAEKLRDKFDFK